MFPLFFWAVYLLCHHGIFLPLPPLSHLICSHRILFCFYCIIDCMFVLLHITTLCCYVSNCSALSSPGRNCKWELVLNLPTWLNKGEIHFFLNKISPKHFQHTVGQKKSHLSVIVEVYLWWKLQASHLFKWENLHNWWLTKYVFAPLYICKMIV